LYRVGTLEVDRGRGVHAPAVKAEAPPNPVTSWGSAEAPRQAGRATPSVPVGLDHHPVIGRVGVPLFVWVWLWGFVDAFWLTRDWLASVARVCLAEWLWIGSVCLLACLFRGWS